MYQQHTGLLTTLMALVIFIILAVILSGCRQIIVPVVEDFIEALKKAIARFARRIAPRAIALSGAIVILIWLWHVPVIMVSLFEIVGGIFVAGGTFIYVNREWEKIIPKAICLVLIVAEFGGVVAVASSWRRLYMAWQSTLPWTWGAYDLLVVITFLIVLLLTWRGRD